VDRLVRTVRWLSNASGIAAVVLTMGAAAVVCEMVFARYVLNASTVWQTEFVLYSIVGATLLGSPYVLAVRGHVGVALLGSLAGPRARRALGVAAASGTVAFCAVLSWSAWRYFGEAWSQGWVTESVWAPRLWIVSLPLPIGLGRLTLEAVVELAVSLTGREGGAGEGAAASGMAAAAATTAIVSDSADLTKEPGA
jgi:TRAP-type C4-dicarboxylate transport system permease small subunit